MMTEEDALKAMIAIMVSFAFLVLTGVLAICIRS